MEKKGSFFSKVEYLQRWFLLDCIEDVYGVGYRVYEGSTSFLLVTQEQWSVYSDGISSLNRIIWEGLAARWYESGSCLLKSCGTHKRFFPHLPWPRHPKFLWHVSLYSKYKHPYLTFSIEIHPFIHIFHFKILLMGVTNVEKIIYSFIWKIDTVYLMQTYQITI